MEREKKLVWIKLDEVRISWYNYWCRCVVSTRVIAEVKTFAPPPAAARNAFLQACDVSRWPEQELCMKQPLHRKKLQLALQALGPEDDDLKGKLDHNWVTSECDAVSLNTSDRALNRDWRLWRLFFRVAGWHRPPAVQEPLWRGSCGWTRAALHDRGELNFLNLVTLHRSLRPAWKTSVAKGLLNNSFMFWLNKTFDSVSQEDLLSLKVGSVLHHLSIKRAIQVLRLNSYTPTCLRRRPSDEVSHLRPRPSRFLFFFFVLKLRLWTLFTPEQRHTSRDLPVDQPQSDGVAPVCGSGRIRSKSEGQRRPRRSDGERGGGRSRFRSIQATSMKR